MTSKHRVELMAIRENTPREKLCHPTNCHFPEVLELPQFPFTQIPQVVKLCNGINGGDVPQVIWALLAPLTVTIIAVILLCPMTARWCLKQTVPGLEEALSDFFDKFQDNFCQKQQ